MPSAESHHRIQQHFGYSTGANMMSDSVVMEEGVWFIVDVSKVEVDKLTGYLLTKMTGSSRSRSQVRRTHATRFHK